MESYKYFEIQITKQHLSLAYILRLLWKILGPLALNAPAGHVDSTSSAPGIGSRACRGCPRRPVLGLDSTSSAPGIGSRACRGCPRRARSSWGCQHWLFLIRYQFTTKIKTMSMIFMDEIFVAMFSCSNITGFVWPASIWRNFSSIEMKEFLTLLCFPNFSLAFLVRFWLPSFSRIFSTTSSSRNLVSIFTITILFWNWESTKYKVVV